MTNEELIEQAKIARKNAYAVISGFKVGAALLTKDGQVVRGSNIEDPSGIGITNICAERCALVKAVSEGYLEYEKIAVVGGPIGLKGEDKLIFCAPCGACRQYLNSWCPRIKVILQENDGIIKEYSIEDLLPYSFNEKF
ncbi:MAG: cytidine deaminase [Oscillospiraceae bacterium]|nr:cytidine deaminase [Oscillospiraceae bacterium]